jgi:regulator of sigma E protease
MNVIIDFIFYHIISVLIVLGVLIFCHELGHFLLAKLFNVKVLKFALGFGPKIVWKQIGETEYSIRWILLGGFVKLLGEDDDEEIKKLLPEEAARALDRQSVFKKIAILAAGSISNILLAIMIFTGIHFYQGEGVYHVKVTKVEENLPAQQAGLKQGDLIAKFDGESITSNKGLFAFLFFKAGIPVHLTILRDNQEMTLQVIPIEKVVDINGEKIKTGYLGIEKKEILIQAYPRNLFVSLWRGVQQTGDLISLTFVSLGRLIQRKVPVSELAGIVGISKITGDAARANIFSLIPMLALLSVAIGLLNLFPIPILDGSLIVIAVIEALRKKPLALNQKEWVFKIGLAFLLTLMLFVTYNDIVYRVLKK